MNRQDYLAQGQGTHTVLAERRKESELKPLCPEVSHGFLGVAAFAMRKNLLQIICSAISLMQRHLSGADGAPMEGSLMGE